MHPLLQFTYWFFLGLCEHQGCLCFQLQKTFAVDWQLSPRRSRFPGHLPLVCSFSECGCILAFSVVGWFRLRSDVSSTVSGTGPQERKARHFLTVGPTEGRVESWEEVPPLSVLLTQSRPSPAAQCSFHFLGISKSRYAQREPVPVFISEESTHSLGLPASNSCPWAPRQGFRVSSLTFREEIPHQLL